MACSESGVAALNIEGQTIHSFAGIGLGNGRPHVLYEKVMKSAKAVTRWQQAKVGLFFPSRRNTRTAVDTVSIRRQGPRSCVRLCASASVARHRFPWTRTAFDADRGAPGGGGDHAGADHRRGEHAGLRALRDHRVHCQGGARQVGDSGRRAACQYY